MEIVLLTVMSLAILSLAVFGPVPGRECRRERHGPPPVVRTVLSPKVVPATPAAPEVTPPSGAVAEIAADFAWANNQTVFVIACRTKRMAIAVGPPGGRA